MKLSDFDLSIKYGVKGCDAAKVALERNASVSWEHTSGGVVIRGFDRAGNVIPAFYLSHDRIMLFCLLKVFDAEALAAVSKGRLGQAVEMPNEPVDMLKAAIVHQVSESCVSRLAKLPTSRLVEAVNSGFCLIEGEAVDFTGVVLPRAERSEIEAILARYNVAYDSINQCSGVFNSSELKDALAAVGEDVKEVSENLWCWVATHWRQ